MSGKISDPTASPPSRLALSKGIDVWFSLPAIDIKTLQDYFSAHET